MEDNNVNKIPKLPHAKEIRIAKCNIQHVGIAKPCRIFKIMKEHKYDCMALSDLQTVDTIQYAIEGHILYSWRQQYKEREREKQRQRKRKTKRNSQNTI